MIDKNYLMVKHAMENQHIGDTIKDYCNGVVFMSESKLSQGQFDEKNTKTALLSDFQVVELKDKLEKRNSTHSDDDNISDGEELGTQVERDITPFVEKCNGGRAGLFVKAKQWKEFNEGISYTGTGDSDVIIKAKMWNYKSNPVLNDTDFDGLDDNVEHNKNPLNNDFSGSTMTVDSDNYVLDLDFNQDFRYFLWNSDTYNDELCTMSLIMSNLAQNKRITIKQGTINYGNNLSIQNYMSKLGFNSIQSETINYDGVTANAYIGYKTIDYYRKKRGVIGIFIGGLNNDKANSEMVLTFVEGNDYYNALAEKIREKINIDRLGTTDLSYCYWISGKGIAGGVAAELAYLYGTEEVYCYTFGSPYTHKGSNNQYAPYIKNIINEDDLLTKVISDETNFSRIGEIYNKSISMDLTKEYKAYIGVSSSSYKGDCSRINTMIRQIFKFIKGEPSTRDVLLAALSKNTGNGVTNIAMSPLTTAVNDATIEISNTNDAQKDASSIKSYYVLSKVLEGIDKSIGKNDKYNNINVSPRSDTNVTARNLVVGNGDEYNPYYTLSNDLQLTTIKNEFWVQAKVDGAVSIDYSISNNYSATIFVHNTALNEECGQINTENDHLDLLEVKNGIRCGYNTYKVHFTKIEDGIGEIAISFNQYQDIKETDSTYLWQLDKNKNHIDNTYEDATLYKEIYHFTKKDAPIIVAKELTDPMMNTRSEIVNFSKDVNDIYSELDDVYNIVTYAWVGASTAGVVGAAIGMGLAIIENITDFSSNSRTAILNYLSKTYSTEKYRNCLVNNSGYHTPVMFVDNINKSFAICEYGLRLLIKDQDLLSNILDPSPKECMRWDEKIAYGQLGCVGVWEDK